MSLRSPHRSRRGMALVLVLVAIALLSLAAYTFAELMYAEREAAWITGRGIQARALADSGCEFAMRFATQEPETLQELGGVFDNPDRFRGVLALDGDAPRERGRFTIIAPTLSEGTHAGIRYGLEDESTRLNLNTLLVADTAQENGGRQLLMALPGMTEEIADAILDWVDTDDEPREFGAELDYYSGQEPPYAPKNGPLETVEELLLVRGVTPALLFGLDVNRNWIVDASEQGGQIGEADNSSGDLNHGWASYLTLYSLEANLRPDGQPRIDINAEDLEQLHADLEEVFDKDIATFILAYRLGSDYKYVASDVRQGVNGREVDLTKGGGRTVSTILDLIGTPIQVTFKGEQQASKVDTPFPAEPLLMSSYLSKLMDNVTANASPVIPGRININQAPRAVLAGIPGMTPEMLQQILNSRNEEPSTDRPERMHETWLLSEGILTLDEMKAMIPYVCGAGRVYRAQVVGYFEQAGPNARVEIVMDATSTTPRLLFYRDLTHLGQGFSPETLGIGAQ